MGPTTKKPSGKKPPNDAEALKSEVASFASSLGLASSAPSNGFDDSDFRKSGPIKPTAKPAGKNDRPEKVQVGKIRASVKPTPKSLPFRDGDHNAAVSRKNDRYRGLQKLPLVKAISLGLWYEDAGELERKVLGERYDGKLDVKMGVEEWKRFVDGKREMGDRLMWQYSQDYEAGRGQSGDIKMLMTTQRSGTAADKVSAFSVLLGDNPLANLRALDALLGMVTSKVGKRHALTGFEALKELFVSSLLPDRKLKTLLQRPLNNLPENKDGYSLLLFWYWEDCLKQRYERFVFALEEASRDMLPILKDKALKTIYALLKSKSEQERRLLSALVNKLGDPQNRSASNADFHLSNLLSDHPNMKAVVIDEVDTFLFRPHLGLRAKYHAVNFLSQIRLSHKGDGPKVAKRLVDVYFALFKLLINEADSNQKVAKVGNTEDRNVKVSKKGEVESSPDSHIELDSRILSALLTGVNRAFPYVSSDEADDVIEAHTPMLFRLVHSDNFNVGIQALMLLDKLSSKNQTVSDRFYRALYSKLLLPAAVNSSKSELFIGLLLRAMKNDVNLKRVSAFAKRLLQVALQQPPQYACGCLFVLSELLKARPPLWNTVLQNESVDEDIEHFEDIMEEIDNTSQAAPKNEQEKPVHYNADIQTKSSEDDKNKGFSSDDDASDGEDVPIEDSSKEFVESKSLSNHNQAQAQSTVNSLAGGYNPRHREPSFCNADHASWWELTVLASHAHPSVATMAGTLLSGANIVYNGNPLNDLSLTAFLDKFMEKKPKQTEWHGGSQIEPAKQLDMSNHLIGPEILSLAEVDVPPEDLVFHKFYVNKTSSTKQNKKKKKKKAAEEVAAEELVDVDDPEEFGGDESDNDEIENMLDSANITFEEEDGGYDYDDLEKIVDEDDDDLVGDASDDEVDVPSDIAEEEDFDGMVDGIRRNNTDIDEDDVNVGEGDNIDDNKIKARKGKRKSRGKSGASPFASLEDYEHLINEDDKQVREKPSKSEKHKLRKKKK